MPEFAQVNRRGFLKFLVGGATAAAVVSIAPPALLSGFEQHDRIVTPKFVKDVDEIRTLNEAIFNKLANGDPRMTKEAIDAVNDFTRVKMREDGFYRRIIPPVCISNDELDRSIETNLPAKIVDRQEAKGYAAISIPFATLPTSTFIRGGPMPTLMPMPTVEPNLREGRRNFVAQVKKFFGRSA